MFPPRRAAIHVKYDRLPAVQWDRCNISMMNLLDADPQQAENAGQRLWREFITFGSASAGMLAVFVVIRIMKFINHRHHYPRVCLTYPFTDGASISLEPCGAP